MDRAVNAEALLLQREAEQKMKIRSVSAYHRRLLLRASYRLCCSNGSFFEMDVKIPPQPVVLVWQFQIQKMDIGFQ